MTVTETAFERVVSALELAGQKVVLVAGRKDQAKSTCPAHEDHNPSLSVTRSGERALLWCFAGCRTEAVVGALGLTLADLYDERSATYRYDDGRKVRRFYQDGRKRFAQSGAMSTSALYHLTRLREVPHGRTVFLVEGEADVHTIEAEGGVATTAPQGAVSFHKVDVTPLDGHQVTCVVDRDAAGDKWAAQVQKALNGIADKCRFVRAAAGKDASDHIAAGYGLDDFEPYDVPELAGSPDPVRQEGANDEEFWSARASLAQLHRFARARRASPWAVLGAVLARVVAATPPSVVLPPLIGGYASLNLFVAVVGPSGAGKGAAERAACDALQVGALFTTASVGSGEGLAHLYARRVKASVERHTDAVLLSVPEIDILTALGARKGATLSPELRRAWSGESLGFSYADPDKRLPIAEQSYRLALVVGVQPARADALLADADGGTPQRFLWFPATDPDAPDSLPSEPAALAWAQPAWPVADSAGMLVLPVCPAAREAVDGDRLARLRGHHRDLDGHALLAQLKTAAALALLEGRAEVADEDWRLAGVVAQVSRRTRDGIAAELAQVDRERNRRRGEAEGDRAVVVARRVEDDAVKRVARLLLRKIAEADGWVTHAELRRSLASRDRTSYFDGAIDRLLASGAVEVEQVGIDSMGRQVDTRRYRTAGASGS